MQTLIDVDAVPVLTFPEVNTPMSNRLNQPKQDRTCNGCDSATMHERMSP